MHSLEKGPLSQKYNPLYQHPKQHESNSSYSHQVRTEVVNNCTESEAVAPGGAHVCDPNILIALGDAATP